MRLLELPLDGWCLEDAEEYHQAAPATFLIPDLEVRKILQPGDFAKLIFSIAVKGEEYPEIERMWVIVRSSVDGNYLGILDNDPYCIGKKNETFWSGIELPFQPRHIIDVQHGTARSMNVAAGPVTRSWR